MPDYLRLPHAEAGNTIGVFGGSFNPPHPGHLMVARTALQRVGLDQVWWMVSPGNPLKDHSELLSLDERVARVRQLASHPKMRVCAYEKTLGSAFTAHTVAELKRRRPHLKFLWIMGGDNLAEFHRWRQWREILENLPVIVVNRPGATLSPLFAPMSITYSGARVPEQNARRIKNEEAPAWTFLHGPLDDTSSSSLRERSD
ncbi:nicotinate-nucleotide adenylyltransferase [Flexibacterium corallicola]|uniref:nicotinate-nucleotide adenylyltransferase n=1 Tax=Flexibacterium corallicola TaxID=3037259 RepID=UPI00286EFFE4|nr:nicotinate-nucleotide adenylyltransferase [Pseudovibrio sp. M1P-2-3]